MSDDDMINYNIDFKLDCWYKNGCNLETNDCQKTCHRYLEMNYLINNCGMKHAKRYLKDLIPQEVEIPAYLELKDIKSNIVDFVENGRNLFITSPHVQTGKTSWALKILYKYFDEIWAGNGFKVRGYFLYVPEFISKCKSFEYKDTEEYKRINKALKRADLVIWDDITAMNLSQIDQNLLNLYIDKRFMEEKANIFTGWSSIPEESPKDKLNDLLKENIIPVLGNKLANRISTNCKVISLEGLSRVK